MALSGSFQSFPHQYLGLYCEWYAEQNATGNYSNVTLNVYLKYHALTVSKRTDSKVSINGQSTTFTVNAISERSTSAHSKLIKTITKRVNHNADGTKSGVVLSASYRFDGTYSGTRIGTISASATVSLNKIDRNSPTISSQITNITANGFKISAVSNTSVDRWRYSVDGGSNYIAFPETTGTTASVSVVNLNPNTPYTVIAEGRKKSNQVIGKSTKIVTTLGAAVITEAPNFAADVSTVSIPVTFNIYEASYTNKLDLYDGDNKIITLSTGFTGTAGEYKKTFSLTSTQRTALLNAMKTVKSKEFTLIVGSYSGSTLVAESSKNILATTSSGKSAPTVGNVNLYDLNQNAGLYAFTTENTLINFVSKVRADFSGFTLKNGAEFSHVTVKIGDCELFANGLMATGALSTKAGTFAPIFTFYDTRGYSVSTSSFKFYVGSTNKGTFSKIKVLEYEKPKFTSISLVRQNMVGTQIDVNVDCRYTQIPNGSENLNGLHIFKCRYKKTSDSRYGNWIQLSSQNGTITNSGSQLSFSQNNFISLPANFAYDFEFYLVDKMTYYMFSNSLDYNAAQAFSIVLKGFPAVSIRNDPNGTGKAWVGVNINNPRSACDVVGDVMMNNHKVLGFVRTLGGNENFDDVEFRDNGIWIQNFNKSNYPDGTNFVNYPCEKAGVLEVVGSNDDFKYLMQRYTPFDMSGIYVRTRYIFNEWSEWQNIWFGSNQVSFTKASGVTLTRHYFTINANICTLYVVGTVDSQVTQGTDKHIGTIALSSTPEYTVSGHGIAKSYNSTAAWVCGQKNSNGTAHSNKSKVYIRSSVALAAGDDFEFTLVWNLDADWQ